jgi:putative transcriptional regulator
MAIRVRLDDLLHARRITLTELSERVGISIVNLSILKTGKARAIRFSTLDAICSALACQPGEILEHVPGEAMQAADDDDGGVAEVPAGGTASE